MSNKLFFAGIRAFRFHYLEHWLNRSRSLIRRVVPDGYGKFESQYWLYHFHPLIRTYLKDKLGQENKQNLEEKHHEKFSLYYHKLLEETYNAVGTKDHVLSLVRFNVIISHGTENDFERAIRFAKDRHIARTTSSLIGSILELLGIYMMRHLCFI